MPDLNPADVRRKGFLPDAVVPDDFDTMGSDEIADLFVGVRAWVEEQVTPADR